MPHLGRTHDDRALLNQDCIDKWGQKTGLLADRRPMLTDARRGDVGFSGRRHHEQPIMRKPEKRLVQGLRTHRGLQRIARERSADVGLSTLSLSFVNNTETVSAGCMSISHC
jgi:hypothetical protein